MISFLFYVVSCVCNMLCALATASALLGNYLQSDDLLMPMSFSKEMK